MEIIDDNAVKKIIDNGNMSTLNSKEDIKLAEQLDLHDWADMVKFARSGGEANQSQLGSQEQQQEEIKLLFVVIMVGMIGIWQQI